MWQRGLIPTRAGDEGRVEVEFIQRPRGQLLEQVARGIGEGGEDDKLAVPRIERRADFLRDDAAQRLQFGIARGSHLLRCRKQRGEAVAVLREILLPAHEVHILEQHFYFSAHEQRLKRGIVHVEVFDFDFLH